MENGEDEPTVATIEDQVSAELDVLATVVVALLQLSEDERFRAMGYLVDRFGAGYMGRLLR